MEKDTVILSLKDYNELKEFKEKTLEGYIIRYSNESFKGWSTTTAIYYPKCKVFEDLLKENKDLEEKNLALHQNIKSHYKEEDTLRKLHKDIIKDIKKMSYWEFRKWKKFN